MISRPLQIERLRQELPVSDGLDDKLRRLQRLRENLDAVIYALSSRELAEDRRVHLQSLLVRHQGSLDDCLAELGVGGRFKDRPPLWHYHQLDATARGHLASILGVPEEPPFYTVLEVKAEEYLAQHLAFQSIGEELQSREAERLDPVEPLAALVLTLSGSLIQLSGPLGSDGARRYRYQNIYGNTHPPQGVLVLEREVRPGHRLRSVELTTSPVRLLRVLTSQAPWSEQAEGFDRMANTLTSIVSRSQSQLIKSGWHRGQTDRHRQVNLEAAERVFAEDNHEMIETFERLRRRFLDRDTDETGKEVEAELLTCCHYMQTAARELGFPAKALPKVEEFTTVGGTRYRVDPERPDLITQVPRGEGPEVVFSGLSVGRQVVVKMAPVAFIGTDGGLVEVTLPVESYRAIPK